jgi:uncharacterized lipoprotein YddW (UPF0748 family)
MNMNTSVPQEPEFRGFWAEGYNQGLRSKEEVDALVERARKANMNALIVQMRKRGDAHYFSLYEPFATNVQSGFDVLAYLIEQAHNGTPRLEVHVWVNSHPLWPGSSWPSEPEHVLNRFPEIQTEDADGNRRTEVGYSGDWGHPRTNDWFYRVLMDIVRRYDVDGIHFDYIRYTGEKWGYNPVSVERFNAFHHRSGKPEPADPLWKQWRRDQVTQVVRKIYLGAVALKPQIKVSAALITWGDGPKDTDDWVNKAAYRSVFQDWQSWLKEGILDMGVPMIYYNQANERYREFYRNWITFLKDHQQGKIGVIGIGNYLNSLDNTFIQIDLAREPSPSGNRAAGLNFFSYAATQGSGTEEGVKWNDDAFYPALTQKFPGWASVPLMTWKQHPTTGHLKGTVLQAAGLSWVDGATVEIVRDGSPVKMLTTDGTGFYGAVHLQPGIYSIMVRAPGVPSQHVGRVLVSPGLVTSVNFLVGQSKMQTVRTLQGLQSLPVKTLVTLPDKVVVEGTKELGGQIRIRDLLGGEAITVEIGESKVPWVAGDVVTIQGILAQDRAGKSVIQKAIVQLVGSEK